MVSVSGGHSHGGGSSGAHSHGGSGGDTFTENLGCFLFLMALVGILFGSEFFGHFVYEKFHHGSVPSMAAGAWGAFYFFLGVAVLSGGVGLVSMVRPQAGIAVLAVCVIATIIAVILRAYVVGKALPLLSARHAAQEGRR